MKKVIKNISKNRPVPTEYEECVTLVDFLNLLVKQKKVIKYTHISNETFTRSWRQKRKNKAMGVTSGVPDYLIVTPKQVLFIEMKRISGGVVSSNQKEWLGALREAGVNCSVCRGFDEAREFLKKYAL